MVDSINIDAAALLFHRLQDPRWAGKLWTIYRGQAYDLDAFLNVHPGGECVQPHHPPPQPVAWLVRTSWRRPP